MIRSREIALRCAASLPCVTLKHRWPDQRREDYSREYAIHGLRKDWLLTTKLMDQLDRCADDSAKRLLLGKGQR